MLESLLARHGAPTLAGLKTGVLFSTVFSGRMEMLACFSYWNRRLLPKGLHMLPLGERRGRTLIYLYRRSALSRDLQHPHANALLTERGYPCPDPERCILHLRQRLAADDIFPHEIGLFLGYPPEDVRGFLRDPSACKYSGCWKVYGNTDAARLLFAQFSACTRLYCRQFALGTPLEYLAIPD
ncbi:MAG: DUF3793 family protein [Ruminococcaceae bacterium]|nr:DUF3793 family protein [Oscillospiraceae bacterium]